MRSHGVLRLVTTCACALLLSVFANGASPKMVAHFINVGQADATLLEFPCGTVMIDAGAQDDASAAHLVDYLKDFFKDHKKFRNTINVLFVTHQHIDHNRALDEIVKNFTVSEYIDNGHTKGSGRKNANWIRGLDDSEPSPHAPEVRPVSDSEITNQQGLTDDQIDPLECSGSDPKIEVLSASMAPSARETLGWSDGDFDNENNHSLAIRVDFGKSSLLFTGDMEEPAIETFVDFYSGSDTLDVDVYHVGHHGSKNGVTESLLKAATPSLAIISMGDPNFGKGEKRGYNTFSFGHPNKRIVELVEEHVSLDRAQPKDVTVFTGGAKPAHDPLHVTKNVYATGWDGDIQVTMTTTDDTPKIVVSNAN